MASLTAFQYRTGNTKVHALDTRFKLFLMAFASITVFNASAWALLVLSCMLVVLCWLIHLPFGLAAKELRYFFLLLLMVFAARVLSTPGEPFVQIWFIEIGKKGLVEGVMVCWRFLMVVVLGLVLISTTRVPDIKRSVAWFFRPVPGVPEKRVATMLGLIVRFIPVIFKKAGEVTAAQQARCIGRNKNPFFRLKAFTIPLLRGIFRDAGNLAVAMEARCYSEHGISATAPATPGDWTILAAGSGFCLAALFL